MKDLFADGRFHTVHAAEGSFDGAVVEGWIADGAVLIHQALNPAWPYVYVRAVNRLKTLVAIFSTVRAGGIVVLEDPEFGLLEREELRSEIPPGLELPCSSKGTTLEVDDIVRHPFISRTSDTDCTDDVCMIVHTAAEDGHYRGAMLTRKSLSANAASVAECAALDPGSMSSAMLPFSHLFGLQTGVFGPAMCGSSVFITEDVSDSWKMGQTISRMAAVPVTHLYSVPGLYYLLAKTPQTEALAHTVKTFTSGAHKLGRRTFDLFERRTGHPIHEGYGLTEASPICTWHYPGDAIRIDSVGRAMSCCEVHAADPYGILLPPGLSGEIVVRGANVMKGYWGDPTLTASTIVDGWLRTGDLGFSDADGFITLTGRRKNMANVSGRKVYPAQVERLLRSAPGVVDAKVHVVESAIQGERVFTEVMITPCDTPAADAIKLWCSTNIARYKTGGPPAILTRDSSEPSVPLLSTGV